MFNPISIENISCRLRNNHAAVPVVIVVLLMVLAKSLQAAQVLPIICYINICRSVFDIEEVTVGSGALATKKPCTVLTSDMKRR